MADTAPMAAAVAAAIQSTESLSARVEEYKERDKTLARLQDKLEDLTTVLCSLSEAADSSKSMSTLLKAPVERCSQLCREFEGAMEQFAGETKTVRRDWTKLEFMGGNIHAFVDTLESYESTIITGLRTIMIQYSKPSRQALESLKELIEDTIYTLRDRLDRFEASLGTGSTNANTNIDLGGEKEATSQCIRVCENAQSYLESLQYSQGSLQREEATPTVTPDKPHRKIFIVGEVCADQNSDQVVGTTIADFFNVGKASADHGAAQLVVSTTEKTLQQLSSDRYRSRSSAVPGDLGHVQTGIVTPSSNLGVSEGSTQRPDLVTKGRETSAETTRDCPSQNEARKRATERKVAYNR